MFDFIIFVWDIETDINLPCLLWRTALELSIAAGSSQLCNPGFWRELFGHICPKRLYLYKPCKSICNRKQRFFFGSIKQFSHETGEWTTQSCILQKNKRSLCYNYFALRNAYVDLLQSFQYFCIFYSVRYSTNKQWDKLLCQRWLKRKQV